MMEPESGFTKVALIINVNWRLLAYKKQQLWTALGKINDFNVKAEQGRDVEISFLVLIRDGNASVFLQLHYKELSVDWV